MNDQTGWAVFFGLILILPLMSLFARRLPLGRVALMALAWVGIFAVGLVGVALYNRNAWIGRGVHELFYGRDQSVVGREVRIPVADDGHFYARATINGVEHMLLVDSGATYTSLSSATASATKVVVDPSQPPLLLDTANGELKAQPARIATLQVGDIVARDAPVAVAPEFGDTDVLGMSFLSKLRSWRVEGKALILIPEPE